MKRNPTPEMWAVVELMGHARTAGIIRTSDLGGLLRVDVPDEEGPRPEGEDGYRTEYYGNAAIYSIKVVSEEIARAYARRDRDIVAYDEPIVPRAQYEEALRQARHEISALEHKVGTLQHRLTAVLSLPPAQDRGEEE